MSPTLTKKGVKTLSNGRFLTYYCRPLEYIIINSNSTNPLNHSRLHSKAESNSNRFTSYYLIINTVNVMTNLNTSLVVLLLFFGQIISHAQVNTTAHDFIPPYTGSFGYGVNFGGYGTSSNVNERGDQVPWLDNELAEIATGNPAAGIPGAGVNSIRLALPDTFVIQNGYDIRLDVFDIYNQLGLRDHTVFLNGPSGSHRDFTEYCPGKPSVIFKNLYLPIWDNGANGTPYNDQNFYAQYVYEVVSRYGKWVKYWEVWNEPDFTDSTNSTNDPGTPGSWWTEDPSPCDLNGAFGIQAPVYHYVRMLRITYEVVKTLYPDSYVATGGLGYPSFLDAILRNTDNPNNGDVSGEYPLKGGAYFDVISWHYYPHVDEALKLWNQEREAFDYFRYSDAAYDGLIQRDREYEAVLERRGYDGVSFPRKLKINTETNVPRVEVLNESLAGGDQFQANYNMKAMLASQAVGLDHLHLFHIGETRESNNVWTLGQQFEVMGLYENLLTQNKNTAKHTAGGIGLKTMSDALSGFWYDAGKTNELQLPSNVRGGAFSNAQGQTTYMLWARTFRDRSEEASVTYTFPPSVPWTSNSSTTLVKKEWNFFTTNQSASVSFRNVQLDGNPAFFELNSTVSLCDGLTLNVNSEVPSCFGFNNGTIAVNATNGVEPYTFEWEDNSGSPLRNNLPSGNYFITVTDGASCSITQAIQLTSPSALFTTVQVRNESVAGQNDGSLTAFASGGTPPYTYSWSNGRTGQTNQGLSAGTYSVTVNDSNACPLFRENIVVEADNQGCGTFSVNTFKTDLTCFGSGNGSISANATGSTGNISYLWNTGQTTQFIDNLSSATYRVTATDAAGCVQSQTTFIASPSQLTVFVNPTQPTNANQNNGRAAAFVSGGTPPYTYLWSTSEMPATIENLTPGSYSVTVTDLNGCQMVGQTELINSEPDCASFQTEMVFSDPRCPGENTGFVSANPINGIPPFNFQWSTGATTQTIGNLPAGTYFVTVNDGAGCIATTAHTLNQKDPLNINPQVTPTSDTGINDGSVTLQINGGTSPYRASWSHGAEGISVQNLAAGAYNVTVYDLNNCDQIAQVIVESNSDDCAGFTDVFFQSENIRCANENDGAIILLPQGGQAPYNYQWSNGANTQGLSNLFAGSYTVTVIDANQCIHIRSITIDEPAALNVAINADLSGECGDVANLTAIGIGGAPPYIYSWNIGSINSAVFNLGSGEYIVTITDANFCTVTETFLFDDSNSFPGIRQTVSDIRCNGESNGFIDINNFTGQAPFSYTWSNGSTTQDIGSLSAGVYDLTVQDVNGCTSQHTFIVSEPNPLELEFQVINPTSADQKGSIKVNVFGGVRPYSYLWDFGAITDVVNNIEIGTYNVTVTDANGCVFSEEVELDLSNSTQDIVRDNAFKVYPNPSKDYFFLEIPNNEFSPEQITLLDIHGKEVMHNNYTKQGNLLRMNAENLVSGTYFIRIYLEDGYTLTKRIVLLNT